MEFVKKHYEKILLGVVLLGLVGALVFLPFMIASDRAQQEQMREGIIHPKVTPLAALDLARETNVLERLKSPYLLDFSTTNKVFNPWEWKITPDFHRYKVPPGGELGSVAVTKITPLYLILTLDSIEPSPIETNELGARYVISMERQAAALPAQRSKKQHYASVGEKVGEKNEGFTVKAVNGSLANPAALKLVVQLTDNGDSVTLSKTNAYRRVDGYAADLKYEPDHRTWQGQRVGAVLKISGNDYIIVAIDPGAVILSARSNQKKTTLTYSPQNSE